MSQLIDSILSLLFERSPSPAAQQAHKLGLVSKGFGLWGPADSDDITHTSRKGPFRRVKSSDEPTQRNTKSSTQPIQKPTKQVPPTPAGSQKPAQPQQSSTPRVAVTDLPDEGPISRTAATKNVIGDTEIIEKNGKKYAVRRVIRIDSNGKKVPIDVSTETGRKTAVKVLTAELEKNRNTIIRAAKTFDARASKQYLGEMGELLTLVSVLAAGGEAYLLPGGTDEDDVLVFKQDKKKGLIVSEVSVKSSLGLIVGSAGSNIRGMFKKVVDGKLMRYGKKSHTADRIVDAILDVNTELLKFLTTGTIHGKDRSVIIPDELKKNFDKKYDPKQFQDKSGKFAALLNARKMTAKDIEQFQSSPAGQKLLQSPNGSAIQDVLEKLKSKATSETTAKYLNRFIEDEFAGILDATKSTFSYTSDLVAVRFNTETGYDKESVRIITATTMQDRAAERLREADRKTGIGCYDKDGRIKGKCQLKAFANLAIRHRALYSDKRNYAKGYTGPIVNAAPATVSVPTYDRQDVSQWYSSLHEIIQVITTDLLSEAGPAPKYYTRFKGVPPEILDRELTYNPIDPATGRLRIDKATGAPKVSKIKLSNVLFTPSKYEKYPALVNAAHQIAGPYMDKDDEEEPREPEEPIADPKISIKAGGTTPPSPPVPFSAAPPRPAMRPPEKIRHVFPINHHPALQRGKFAVKYLKHITPYKNKQTTQRHLALLLLTVLLYFKKHKKSVIQQYFGQREDLPVLKRLAKQIVDTFPTEQKLITAMVDTLDHQGGDLIFIFDKSVIKIADFDGFAAGLNVKAEGKNIEQRVARLMTKLLPIDVLQQPKTYYFIHDVLAPVDDLSMIGSADFEIEGSKVTYRVKNLNSTDLLQGIPNNTGNGYLISFAQEFTELLDIN